MSRPSPTGRTVPAPADREATTGIPDRPARASRAQRIPPLGTRPSGHSADLLSDHGCATVRQSPGLIPGTSPLLSSRNVSTAPTRSMSRPVAGSPGSATTASATLAVRSSSIWLAKVDHARPLRSGRVRPHPGRPWSRARPQPSRRPLRTREISVPSGFRGFEKHLLRPTQICKKTNPAVCLSNRWTSGGVTPSRATAPAKRHRHVNRSVTAALSATPYRNLGRSLVAGRSVKAEVPSEPKPAERNSDAPLDRDQS